jgi:hypothetical protein
MSPRLKRKLAIGSAALAAAAFAGGAFAATQESGGNVRQAFLNDVAKRLNVSPSQLTGALQGAFFDQLQTAVADGKLTQAQANAIKQRVQKNGLPPLGGWGERGRPGVDGFHLFRGPGPLGGNRLIRPAGPLDGAAKYLGLTDMQLRDQLASGKSLAQVAKARGKSVPGLKAAMIAAMKANLDKAVAGKMLTSAQEQQILNRMSSALDKLINASPSTGGPGLRWFHGPRGPDGPGPAPDGPGPAPDGPQPGPAIAPPPPPGAPSTAY